MDVLFPPGPQKSLLLGDAPQFKQNPLDYMLRAARTYGDLVHFRFGPSHAYLVTNPRDAHVVLVERFDQFAEKPSLLRALNSAMGHDLFAPEDRLTKRTLPRGAFKAQWLDALSDAMTLAAAQALDGWQGGDPIPMLRELTLALVTRTLFGDATDGGKTAAAQLEQALSTNREGQHFQSPLTPPAWFPTAQNRQRQRAAAELKRIVQQIIEDHRERGRYDVLSCLLHAADSEALALEEMIALFRAGHNATTNTLAWAWSLLAQHPESAESLQAEVDGVLGSRIPTAEDLAKLPYCEMILKETLRLHPPVWVISRQAKRETRLGEYYVPAGSTIFISPYIVHHSARYYSSPEHFLPERFSEGLTRRGSGYAYMPFGAGTYAQVEHDYVMRIGKLILALSAQRFRLALLASPPTSADSELSAQPHGLRLQTEAIKAAV